MKTWKGSFKINHNKNFLLIFNKEVIDYAFEKVNPYSMYVLLLIFWAPHKQRKKKKNTKYKKKFKEMLEENQKNISVRRTYQNT